MGATEQLLLEMLGQGAGASYLSALLNQPKFPGWVRQLVVVAVCLGGALVKEIQSGQVEQSSLLMRAGVLFASATLMYQTVLKNWGAGWLTEQVTPERVKGLFSLLFPSKPQPSVPEPLLSFPPVTYPSSPLVRKLDELAELQSRLTQAEYDRLRQETLGLFNAGGSTGEQA